MDPLQYIYKLSEMNKAKDNKTKNGTWNKINMNWNKIKY